MRLDVFLYENKIYPSRTKSMEAIKEGLVLYDNKPCKCSLEVDSFDKLTILNLNKTFVSNGGYKLEKAIKDFDFDVTNLVCADIGASNGGFTDCLLQRNAQKVFAIDVGNSQLDSSLLSDKVVVLDNVNARYLDKSILGEKVDLVVCDVSFISLKLVLPAVKNVLKDGAKALMLIKPQFECGLKYLGNSGIVKNRQVRINACLDIYNFAVSIGLTPLNITVAPIKEKKNVEYVILLENSVKQGFSLDKFLSID